MILVIAFFITIGLIIAVLLEAAFDETVAWGFFGGWLFGVISSVLLLLFKL